MLQWILQNHLMILQNWLSHCIRYHCIFQHFQHLDLMSHIECHQPTWCAKPEGLSLHFHYTLTIGIVCMSYFLFITNTSLNMLCVCLMSWAIPINNYTGVIWTAQHKTFQYLLRSFFNRVFVFAGMSSSVLLCRNSLSFAPYSWIHIASTLKTLNVNVLTYRIGVISWMNSSC